MLKQDPSVKTVIFNADDFGACHKTNAAIVRAHREGVLTATSLMVTEPGAEEAVQLARACPGLAVGLHVAISNAATALTGDRARPYAAASGRFEDDPVRAALRYSLNAAAARALAEEIEAQFDRFAQTGLPWSHVDGHQHLHMIPPAWPHVLRLAERHGVKRVRVLWEEFRPYSAERRAGRRVEWYFLTALGRRCRRQALQRGFLVADRVYGQLETGQMRAGYVERLLGDLGGQVNEIYLHPGTDHARPLEGRADGMDVDLDALLSPAVRERVEVLGLRLSSYLELGGAAPAREGTG